MKQLELDHRSLKDIVEEIKEKAVAYTPEWRMDEDNPDIGTALALVYANLFAKTVKNFNQTPIKNEIAFYNYLGAGLLPAIPSTGYVKFSLVNDEVSGVEVPMHTIVSADTADEKGVVEFETTDDLYVTPAQPSLIYQTNDKMDFIEKLFDAPNSGADFPGQDQDIELFHFKGINLQEHTLYFSHDEVLNLKKNAAIELCLYERETRRVSEAMLGQLLLEHNAQFEYFSTEGYIPFSQKSAVEGSIQLFKSDKQPPFERMQIGDIESFVIRCRVHNIGPFRDMEVERLLLRAKGSGIPCDTISSNGVECNQARFFPFGERFSLYNEVYFGSEEVFCKRGARISLSFNVDYVSVPLEYNLAHDPMEWKWVTDRSNLRPNPEYELSIEEIIWEYYNGSGWARLFSDNSYAHLFRAENGAIGQYQTIRFTCPQDITPLLINATESFFIRARVLKINNLYKVQGNYISPVMSNTSLSYDYAEAWAGPERITITNNLETADMTFQDMLNLGSFLPFAQTGLEQAAVYLGFDVAPLGAPIKLLLTIRDATEREGANLSWEYYDGSGWPPLNLLDETGGFLHSGLITIMDNRSFAKKRLFDAEKYWIRIVDKDDFYSGEDAAFPTILSLHMNVVGIINVDQQAVEDFTMEIYQENTIFKLLHKHVTKIDVYIDEIDDLYEERLLELQAEREVRLVHDEAGLLKKVWVKWDRVDDFSASALFDRHYMANCNEGYILFGNGKCGRIPPVGREANISVAYKTGGGERTNLPAGAVQKLDRAIGFITEVINPAPLTGGYDVEPLHKAITRNSAMLRTQDRAVTARDFEKLAAYANRNVEMARCFAGYDEKGHRKPGLVTLVVLRKDYQSNRTRFAPVKNEIYKYLEGRISGNLMALDNLFIIEPKFVELRVRAEISIADMNQVFAVKKDVQNRLDQFIDVVKGNFDGKGWKIGRLPNEIQIRNAIIDIDGIEYVKNIFITAYTNEASGWKETELGIIKNHRYVLPLRGEHEILISVG